MAKPAASKVDITVRLEKSLVSWLDDYREELSRAAVIRFALLEYLKKLTDGSGKQEEYKGGLAYIVDIDREVEKGREKEEKQLTESGFDVRYADRMAKQTEKGE
jgi:metal-responsive CopG/Arc/MetJ family transcriptional regulator